VTRYASSSRPFVAFVLLTLCCWPRSSPSCRRHTSGHAGRPPRFIAAGRDAHRAGARLGLGPRSDEPPGRLPREHLPSRSGTLAFLESPCWRAPVLVTPVDLVWGTRLLDQKRPPDRRPSRSRGSARRSWRASRLRLPAAWFAGASSPSRRSASLRSARCTPCRRIGCRFAAPRGARSCDAVRARVMVAVTVLSRRWSSVSLRLLFLLALGRAGAGASAPRGPSAPGGESACSPYRRRGRITAICSCRTRSRRDLYASRATRRASSRSGASAISGRHRSARLRERALPRAPRPRR